MQNPTPLNAEELMSAPQVIALCILATDSPKWSLAVDLLADQLIVRGLNPARLAEIIDVVGPVGPLPTTFRRSLVTYLKGLHKRSGATKAFVAQIYPSIVTGANVVSLMNRLAAR